MGTMYPSLPLKTNSSGEVTVFNIFKNNLSDDWHIFHSYRWNRNVGLRENDFILINETHGVIVVEVKGGRVNCLGHGQWTATDRYGFIHNIQDPYVQVSKGQVKIYHELDKHLKSLSLKPVKCSRVVIFPDVKIGEIQFMNTNQSDITMLQDELFSTNIPDKLVEIQKNVCKIDIPRIFSDSEIINHTRMSSLQFQEVLAYFNSALNTYYNENEIYLKSLDYIKTLTEEQFKIIDITNDNDKVCITGAPGTGKTTLALYKAKLDIESGKKILILCTTQRLRDDYDNAFSGYSDVKVFTKQYYFSNEDKLTSDFDSIIIDEGQDFDNEEIYRIMKKSLNSTYIFMDKGQILDHTRIDYKFNLPNDFTLISLKENLRNSLPIKNFLNKINNLAPLSQPNDQKEIELIFIKSTDVLELIDYFINLFQNKCISTKYYSNSKPLFITPSSVEKSSFICDRDEYGDCYLGSALDTVCNRCPGKFFDTVRRLKGTEYDCVIYYDEKQFLNSELFDQNKTSKYFIYKRNIVSTAISRARFDLTLVVPFTSDKECNDLAKAMGLSQYSIRHTSANFNTMYTVTV